jgi:hypothetical protein
MAFDPSTATIAEEPKGRVTAKFNPDSIVIEEEKKPSFGQKAGAVAYGLATSIPGTLGDIESVLPGGPEVGAKGKGALKGYETVFPTTKNIQSGLSKLGVPQPSESVSGYQTAGEFLPAALAGGKAVYELGKYGVGKIGKMMSGGKDLAEELQKTTGKRLQEEISTAGTQAETAQSRALAAEKIAQREAGKSEAAYSRLPGVTVSTEAGATKPIPQSLNEIGTDIRSIVDQKYNALKATREANATTNKAEAFNFALNKEKAGQKVADTEAFKDALKTINAEIVNPDTKLAIASVDAIKNQLLQVKRAINPREVDPVTGIVRGKPVSFEGLENLRRFLRDRASGLPAEGFDAISQQQAGRLAKVVEGVMEDFSPGIRKFIDQYRIDSEPMRVFQTKVGKALTDEQLFGKGANYAKVPAQSIPTKVFKTPEDYRALIDALGGDVKLAEQSAQRYFVSQLESRKTANQLQQFLRDNRTMLKETNSAKMADDYVKAAITAEQRGAKVTEMGATRTATAAEKETLKNDLMLINSDLERAKDINEINAQVTKVANRLEKAGVMNIQQRDQFLREVNAITDAQKKKEYIRKGIRIGVYGAIGTGAATGAYNLITK